MKIDCDLPMMCTVCLYIENTGCRHICEELDFHNEYTLTVRDACLSDSGVFFTVEW